MSRADDFASAYGTVRDRLVPSDRVGIDAAWLDYVRDDRGRGVERCAVRYATGHVGAESSAPRDDLAAVDPLEVDRRDSEVGMLALDNEQWDALVSQLDRVLVAESMRREPASDPCRGGGPAQLAARGRRFPVASGGGAVDHAEQRADREPDAEMAPGLELLPRPAVHPDLATPADLPVADQHRAARLASPR
jgi:hypothetical protein